MGDAITQQSKVLHWAIKFLEGLERLNTVFQKGHRENKFFQHRNKFFFRKKFRRKRKTAERRNFLLEQVLAFVRLNG